MKAEKEANEIIEKFKDEIGGSDFHVPDFITGVPMADGSKEYSKILENETNDLARQCALVHVDRMLDVLDVFNNFNTPAIGQKILHLRDVKQIIETK